MDVRAKQRLCLLACPLNLSGRVFGFAPRHLSRWASSRYPQNVRTAATSFFHFAAQDLHSGDELSESNCLAFFSNAAQ